MAYGDYKVGGQCKLYLCDVGKLSALPGVEADFTELKIVKSNEITAPNDEAEAGDRQGGGFKGFVPGDADFRMSLDVNTVVGDAGYILLAAAKAAKTPIGVLSAVGDPNAAGVRIDYFEAYVLDMPATQNQNEVVSGTVELVRAAGTIVPVYNHKTAATGEVWA